MSRKEQIEKWCKLVAEHGLDRVEWSRSLTLGFRQWSDGFPDFFENYGDDWVYAFRVVPATGTSREMQLPLAEREALEFDAIYYIPNYTYPCLYRKEIWTNSMWDWKRLEQGIVYLRPEDAIAVAKASTRHNEWVKWDDKQ